MTAQELLQQGKVDESLAALQNEVRAAPNDAKLRVFLFQLMAVKGQWERAINQLNVCKDLDIKTLEMLQVCGPAIGAERLREDIFAGNRSPLLLGEPEEWIGLLVQSLSHFAKGEHDAARDLREKAFEAAPGTSGTLKVGDQQLPFEWISDADQRLGPVLEAIIDGKYYWVPFSRLKDVTIEAPKDLRDLVWVPSILTLSAGAKKVALLPTRYPGTEKSSDSQALLARRTDWVDQGDIQVGIGQRLLATDAGEFSLLEIRSIVLNTVAPPSAAGAEAGAAGGVAPEVAEG